MKKIYSFTLLSLVLLAGGASHSAQAQNHNALADGAKLWASNCMRCHSARSPMERIDREWLTITNHMRARANLTKTEANLITFYLQSINTPEAGVVAKLAPMKAHAPLSSKKKNLKKKKTADTDS